MHLVEDLIELCAEVVNKEELMRKFDRSRSSTFGAPALVLIG